MWPHASFMQSECSSTKLHSWLQVIFYLKQVQNYSMTLHFLGEKEWLVCWKLLHFENFPAALISCCLIEVVLVFPFCNSVKCFWWLFQGMTQGKVIFMNFGGGATPGYTQDFSLLCTQESLCLGKSYEMLGIEPMAAECKANALPLPTAVLSF